MKQGLMASLIFVVLAAGVLTSCGGLGGKAEFQLSSLTITPSEVTAGERVIVSVDVANVGSRQGTYEGILLIDGEEWEEKNISVTKEGTEKLTFILTPGVPGRFEISVGGLSGFLTVNPRTQKIELGYDDGRPDGVVRVIGIGQGYLVRFSPPATPFYIEQVRIYGSLYGEIYTVQKFQLQIWGENQDVILYDHLYPYTAFSSTPGWAEVKVENVRPIEGAFYIHICTSSTENSGVQVFYDSSVVNDEHSYVTKEWKLSEEWYLEQPQEEVNWMIRVDGTIFLGIPTGEESSE